MALEFIWQQDDYELHLVGFRIQPMNLLRTRDASYYLYDSDRHLMPFRYVVPLSKLYITKSIRFTEDQAGLIAWSTICHIVTADEEAWR